MILKSQNMRTFAVKQSLQKWLRKQDQNCGNCSEHVNIEGRRFCVAPPLDKNYRQLITTRRTVNLSQA